MDIKCGSTITQIIKLKDNYSGKLIESEYASKSSTKSWPKAQNGSDEPIIYFHFLVNDKINLPIAGKLDQKQLIYIGERSEIGNLRAGFTGYNGKKRYPWLKSVVNKRILTLFFVLPDEFSRYKDKRLTLECLLAFTFIDQFLNEEGHKGTMKHSKGYQFTVPCMRASDVITAKEKIIGIFSKEFGVTFSSSKLLSLS